MSFKKELINFLIETAANEIDILQDFDEDEEIEEVLDNLQEDLAIVDLFRYSCRGDVPKSCEWYENTLPNYDDDRFKVFVRMDRNLFDVVLDLIKDHEVFHGTNSSKQFSVFFQLAVVMYRLGGSTNIRKTAAQFGMGDGGSVAKITKRVFTAILSLQKFFLTWPSKEEREELVDETKDELPLCIGYLDGTEIPLAEAPSLDKESYFSRNKQYSVKLQAICDHKLRFRQINVGYPGSVHDARIFNECPLAKSPQNYLSEDQWIAADSAYKLTEYVITPFRSNSIAATAEKRKKFNTYFSGYRVRIEHCFGFLKNKFPSLQNLDINIHHVQSNKQVCLWVHVCCILHNIILPHLSEEDFNFLTANTIEEEDEEYSTGERGVCENDVGEIKRQALYETIFDDVY